MMMMMMTVWYQQKQSVVCAALTPPATAAAEVASFEPQVSDESLQSVQSRVSTLKDVSWHHSISDCVWSVCWE